MHTYRVWLDNGSAVLVNAYTERDARAMALEQAMTDGYCGLGVSRVEDLGASYHGLAPWFETRFA